VFLAAAAEPDRSPLDFMLALMRDPQGPLDLRIDMAAAAAPFVHARPRPSRASRPHPMELRARQAKAALRDGAESGLAGSKEKTTRPGGEEKTAVGDRGGQALGEGGEKQALRGGGEIEANLSPIAPAANGRDHFGGPGPLDFLLAVMRDPEAPPRQRVRAARVAARYKHRPPERPAPLVEDEFGFKIDPVVAKAVRDTRRQPRFKDIEKQNAWVREHIGTIECPDGYGGRDFEKDEERLREFQERRKPPAKLTPDEVAEEAYLVTRTEVYRRTPKHGVWRRLSELEVRRAGWTPLTAAELSELDDLRARFPTVANDLAGVDWTAKVPVLINLATLKKWREHEKRGLSPAESKKLIVEDLRREEAELPPDDFTMEGPITRESLSKWIEHQRERRRQKRTKDSPDPIS
jgi:hypothetical protein